MLPHRTFGGLLVLCAMATAGPAIANAPETSPLPPKREGGGQPTDPPTAPADAAAAGDPPLRAPLPPRRPGLATSALIGIFSLTTGRTALLLLPGGEVRQLAVGDTIDGWRVSAISETTLRMTRGGQTRTFPLLGN